MLKYLHIENIAVIENANIDFTEGFNVMTGETGAGKSIIIDSLYAILGERTSRELIRHGCDKALVSAAFCDIGPAALSVLNELGFSLEPGEELVIQRVLFADGRGQVKINSQPANVSTLKEIGKYLINIHGQHDNQSLLNPEKHILFIDSFADNQKEKEDYLKAFEEFRNVTRELKLITADLEEKEKETELLRFQIDELEKSEIKIGEEEKLKEDISLMQRAETVLEKLSLSDRLISGAGAEEELSALEMLKTALKSLENTLAVLPKAEKVVENLSSLVMDLEGVAGDIGLLADQINCDPNLLEKSITRLDLIHSLMLKYGDSEEKLLDYLEKAKIRLKEIDSDTSRKDLLEDRLEPLQDALVLAGKELSKTRAKASVEICKKIADELQFLDFNGAQFCAPITSGKYTKNGADVTEFLISANVGEVPKPLVKIASGGELSRIMLAIRSVLSLKDDVGTLVFDEIDTGISGHAAGKVGVKLYQASKNRQVICVTHLAQIASAADNHLFISKSVKEGKTFTSVEPLDYNGRVREIARIMSGGEYTENLLKTAEEMINFSKKI